MKSFQLSLILLFTTFIAKAQLPDYFINNSLTIVDLQGDTIPFPFTGGLVAPQFSSIDMNGDGYLDLYVFDRDGNKTLCFLSRGIPGQASFVYSPAYEHYFPSGIGWALLRDYNCDGHPDMFTGNENAGIDVYMNKPVNGKPNFTLAAKDLVDKTQVNMSVGILDIPAFDDIDMDGDLDLITFPPGQEIIYFYRNQQKEENLPCDSLRFKLVDYCWGNFIEHAFSDSIIMPYDCFLPKDYSILRVHSGSTLLTIDLDGDNDKDLIIGDVSYASMNTLTNGKVEKAWAIDTMISYEGNFPSYDVPVNIPYFPSAFYLDINNDGKKELIASSNNPTEGKNINQIWWYQDVSPGITPDFEFRDSTFLHNMTLDFGSHTKPVFYDYDQDGDQDLFVVYAGNYVETQNQMDRVALFKNNGDSLPVFEQIEDDFLQLSGDKLRLINLCFADLDGDQLDDLLIGVHTGKIRYYHNTGTQGNPIFSFVTDTLGGIDVGSVAAPAVFDMNNDSLPDLVVGSEYGPLKLYLNKGTKFNPYFADTSDVDTLWKVWPNSFQLQIDTDSNGNPTDPVKVFHYDGYSTPQFIQFHQDSSWHLVIGAKSGLLSAYPVNLSNYRDSIQAIPLRVIDPFDSIHHLIDIGNQSVPAFSDLNKDGIPDLMVGSSRGGLQFYLSQASAPDTVDTYAPPVQAIQPWAIYPNPASESCIIRMENEAQRPEEILIYDLHGRLLMQLQWHSNGLEEKVSLQTLPQGAYLVRVLFEDHSVSTKKLIRIPE